METKRNMQLQDIGLFIKSSYEKLDVILEELGWDKDYLGNAEKLKSMSTCPINSQHRVPSEKLHEHITRCKWKDEGYSDLDVLLPEVTEHNKSTVVIDNSRLEKRCVPLTSDRITSDFTPAERLVLYDYAISNTIPPAVLKPEELDISYQKHEGNYTKSKLELLMEMRDAKRRRTSYRSKKVHTNRKSHVEILREVIQKQMEYLRELNGIEGEEEEEAEHSGNDNINMEQGNVEIDATETRKTNSSISNLLNVADSSSDNLRAGGYDSQEYQNREKVVSRNESYGGMAHNKHHKRINAYANHEKYEEHLTSGNYYDTHSGSRREEMKRHNLRHRHFSEFPFESHSGSRSDCFREGKYKQHYRSRNLNDFASDGHSGYRSDSRREEKYEKPSASRNLYEYPFDSHSESKRRETGHSKRKRERGGSSDTESPDNMGSRKKEYAYLRSEPSKYHGKRGNRHRTHDTHDHSFSRSEKRPKLEVKKEEERIRGSRSFYGQESDWEDDSQNYHDESSKHNLVDQIFARSDSESSEISRVHGRHNIDTSEDEYMSHKEKYVAPHYYSPSNHVSETDNVKKEHHQKKKHHKKKTKKKHKDRKSSESRFS